MKHGWESYKVLLFCFIISFDFLRRIRNTICWAAWEISFDCAVYSACKMVWIKDGNRSGQLLIVPSIVLRDLKSLWVIFINDILNLGKNLWLFRVHVLSKLNAFGTCVLKMHGKQRRNQNKVVNHQSVNRYLWLAWNHGRLQMVFQQGQKLPSRGLTGIVWSESLCELQWKIAFRCYKNVKPHRLVGCNLDEEANSVLRMKYC